jgi:hypothetical protein
VSFQTPAKDHHFGGAQMIDGRLIFVWLGGEGINIWDTEKGELLQMVDVYLDRASDLRISGDGSKVFLYTGEFIQAWSIWTGEVAGGVEVGGNSFLDSFPMDGSRIWVHYKDKPTQGWDFGISGSSPVPLSKTSLKRPRLYFITHIGSWGNGPSRIEDTVTGKVVFQLSGRYAKPTDVRWDGHYLVASYWSREVLILDFGHLCLE